MTRRSTIAIAGLALAIGLIGSGPARATFPGANGMLVFTGVDSGTQTLQIYTVSEGGGGLTQVTQAMGQPWNECPSWSSEGTWIFFDTFPNPGASLIYRIHPDGTGRQLADRPSPQSHNCPSVGPGGTRVVVVQTSPRNFSTIVRMKLDGTRRRTLGRAGRTQMVFDPEYGPEGRRIVFNRVTFKAKGGIARADLIVSRGLGRKNVDITRRSKKLFSDPSWSPEGRSLLAVRGNRTIVRMRPNGKDVRVLKTVPGKFLTVNSPVFSPDGSKIAYLQCVGDCGDPDAAGTGSLWVMNAEGSNSTQIVAQDSGVQPASKLDWGVAGSAGLPR